MNKRQTCAVVFSPDLSLLVLLKQPLTDSSVKVVGTGSATSLPDLIRQERPNVIVCDIEGTPQSAIESISLPLKESDADVVLVDAKPLAEQWLEDEAPVRIKTFTTKPMGVEEAIMQMNLLGHNFFVFVNSDGNVVNALYRRNDGKYGLLTPEK